MDVLIFHMFRIVVIWQIVEDCTAKNVACSLVELDFILIAYSFLALHYVQALEAIQMVFRLSGGKKNDAELLEQIIREMEQKVSGEYCMDIVGDLYFSSSFHNHDDF